MLILSSYNSQKDKTNTPYNKRNLDLMFTASQKSILKLDSTDNINNLNKKYSKKNKIQLLKIKKLITEFEKEKNEKERLLRLKNKKNNKKKKNNNGGSKIPVHNSKSPQNIFIPNKKVYFNVPKIKSQMQFNRYLINDFKENDSEQDYIKRSKKYQKINEDFDELTLMKQIKEVAKNGITENIEEEDYPKNEPDYLESPDSDMKSNNSNNKYFHSRNSSVFNVNDILKKNSFYDSKIRRLYTEKIKINDTQNSLNKRMSNKINPNNNNTTERTKVSEKENSFIEEKEKENINDNNNKSAGIKYLIGIKNKNKNIEIRPKKKKLTSIDKYNFSKRLYNAQMKEYNRYVKKKQYMRGKNFSKQIALINKEKEKLGIVNKDNEETNTERGLPKLIIPNLLFHIEYSDIFKNSFNTFRVFEEGDQDLDLDDLNKIKNSIKDYEMEMIKVLKKNNNLNYIKKRFNKTTVGKFQSTKGIYFGN